MAAPTSATPESSSKRAGRRGLRYAGIAILAIAATWVFLFKASPTMPDFEVYWRAGGRAAAAEPLYRADDGHFQFKYLPAFAMLAMPLGATPISLAEAIWFCLSLAALVVLLRTSVAILPERRLPVWLLISATVVVLGKFYVHELVLGQANLFFATTAAAAIVSARARRDVLAGLLVALAIVIKPYGVLLLPWLALRRQPRAMASVGAAMAAALLLPAALYGFGGDLSLHREWLRTVVETTSPNLANVDNISWLAMYGRWFGQGDTAASLATVTALAAMAAALWMLRAGRSVTQPDGLEVALLLVLVPLLSPQGWDYVLLVSTPAVVYLVNYADGLPGEVRVPTLLALAVIGLSIYDVVGRAAYQAFMRYSGITLCYFVVIAALVELRRRRIA
jgi:hypothetical protein